MERGNFELTKDMGAYRFYNLPKADHNPSGLLGLAT
jgi:hypothetical protein